MREKKSYKVRYKIWGLTLNQKNYVKISGTNSRNHIIFTVIKEKLCIKAIERTAMLYTSELLVSESAAEIMREEQCSKICFSCKLKRSHLIFTKSTILSRE